MIARALSQQIVEYEVLLHDDRLQLLLQLDTHDDLSYNEMITYYCLLMVGVGYSENEKQLYDYLYNHKLQNSSAVCAFVRDSTNYKNLIDRQTMIDWCEARLVKLEYWGENKRHCFVYKLAQALNWMRYSLVSSFMTYTAEQLHMLKQVNSLFVKSGTQLFYKTKSYQNRYNEPKWKGVMEDAEAEVYLEAVFTQHQCSEYDRWLAHQFTNKDLGSMKWGDYLPDSFQNPEEYIYRFSPDCDDNPDEKWWLHWDEGTDRDKVKSISLCYIYHDLWDHQDMPYTIPDILRIKEVKTHVKVNFTHHEEADVWSE